MLFPAQQNIQGLPLTDSALVDSLPLFDSSLSSNQRITVERLLAIMSPICCGRLTTQSGTPISTSDRTSQSTLYFTPYKGNVVKLYDGTRWKLCTFTEVSKALTGLTANINYDVFLYDSSGTLTLEFVGWTNDTTRATTLVTQDGIFVKNGDATRLYLGTFRSMSSTTTEDSQARRLVWNYYNRVERTLLVTEATNSWTYSTASWRSANNSTANRVAVVVGWAEVVVSLTVGQLVNCETGGAAANGIAEDATNTSNADIETAIQIASTGDYIPLYATLRKYPTVGYHYYQWTEYGAMGTVTWFGTYSDSTLRKASLLGSIWG